MKPGSKDFAYPFLITGLELEELQRFAWTMTESFGLDKRIYAYRGTRPIGLYRWDIELICDVIESALVDRKAYPHLNGRGHEALVRLQARITALRDEAFADMRG